MSNRRTALLLLLIAAPLAASATGTNKGTTRRRTAKAKTNPQDNGESRSDRERRLARECRHLPNAGACLGYGYGS